MFGPRSEFAKTTYRNKYAHLKPSGQKENWEETARRVVQTVTGPYLRREQVDKIENMVRDRKFMPGGRYLYAAGRRYGQYNNCLGGETEILTSEGVFTLKELAGKTVKVRNRFGVWEWAEVRSFGRRQLLRIHFSNGEVVRATADHQWWQDGGYRIPTTEIERVPLGESADRIPLDEEGIRHGFAYGDATTQTQCRTDRLVFCTEEKREMAGYFHGAKELSAGLTVSRLPRVYRSLPDLKKCSPSYARGFIAGLLAADGSTKTSSVTLFVSGRKEAYTVRNLAVLGGCVVSKVSRVGKAGDKTNLSTRKRDLFCIRIKPFSAPAVRPDQIRELASRKLRPTKMYLEVERVTYAETEEVYCCVVPTTESFTLANGLVTSNCFLFRSQDSREGWATLLSDAANALMTGGGIGVVYSDLRPEDAQITGLGGRSSGPCSLMQIINEQGRFMRQGGSRRSAIWAGLHWWHPDIFKFINLKDWPEWLRERKQLDYNTVAPMDGTNISVILDDGFFEAMENEAWSLSYNLGGSSHTVNHAWASRVYNEVVRHMLETSEPGFSVDIGDNAGENCRNAPVHGDTRVLTDKGYQRVQDIVGISTTVWTGENWAPEVVFKKTGSLVNTVRVKMTGGREIVCEPEHPFLIETWHGRGKRRKLTSVVRVPAGELEPGDIVKVSLPEIDPPTFCSDFYTLGFIQGDGSFRQKSGLGKRGPVREVGADLHLCCQEKVVCSQGFSESLIRSSKPNRFGYTSYTFKTSPLFDAAHKEFVPESVQEGPAQGASYLAGLFDADGSVDQKQHRIRFSTVHYSLADGVVRLLESLGILAGINKGGPSGYGGRDSWTVAIYGDYVGAFIDIIPTLRLKLEVAGWEPYRNTTIKVESVEDAEPADVYCADVKLEEHSFQAEGVIVSNCCEVVSRDNRDMCNLASINLAQVGSLEEFAEIVEMGTAFLLCGTLASQLPVPEMYKIREKNRRLGLGLMGVHEWLLRRGYRYEPNDELAEWLKVYERSTYHAYAWADRLSVSRPVATRSIAPTGTISIVAETTSGIEPVFAVAYRRNYLDGNDWKYQYVIDATARRLIEENGVDPALIEDSFTLAEDVERRITFQEWMQRYVDHGISSTINLPEWGSSINNESTVDSFGRKLMKHLKGVRGITAYADGSRGGQPLTRVPYTEAVRLIGTEFTVEERETGDEGCKGGVCNA